MPCKPNTLVSNFLLSVYVAAGKVQWVKFLAEEYFLLSLAFPEARLPFLASISLCKRDMF